jgi:hypothetical protein
MNSAGANTIGTQSLHLNFLPPRLRIEKQWTH